MKILLTGANGYIGMRLLPVLLEQGHEVHCVVRNRSRFVLKEKIQDQIKVYEVNFLESVPENSLPINIDVAYFLIHSMSSGRNFDFDEKQAAGHFVDYINSTNAQQIVYLGGISNDTRLSKHLRSRKEVENILSKSKVPVTVLRAGIIVGSGSASFEIIRDLVEKLPIMITPKWILSRCQPIAIRNVLQYLSTVINVKASFGQIYDIAGPDVLTYKDMLLQFAKLRGLKRHIITVPFLSPTLSSYWLYFVTSTSFHLARNLIESLKVEVIAKDDRIQELLPVSLISYKDSVKLAFQKIEQNQVISSWKDAMASGGGGILKIDDYVEVPSFGCYKDRKVRLINRDPDEILGNIWRIGGKQGWYYGNYLWKLRGFLDKLVGGIGLKRGRRSPTDIYPGDTVDFWRVLVSNKKKRRLLLYAEMKLPGEAWLEFKIIKRNEQYYLRQTATFRPKGLAGRGYWFLVMPFHLFIFNGMIKNICEYKS